MTKYSITGMACAGCSARVENAVSQLESVQLCSVNLLTNSMIVEGEIDPEEIIQVVEKAGYGASVITDEKNIVSEEEGPSKDEKNLAIRLCVSLVFLFALLFFSMIGPMAKVPFVGMLEEKNLSGVIQAVLAIIVMGINYKFFTNGFKTLFTLSPNMDTLVALGSTASFAYSLYVMIADSKAHLFFEGAAMIVTLITVGKLLEAKAKGKTTNALKSLLKLTPKTAVVLINGEEKEIPVEQVRKGDVFIVRSGQNIPVDGVIVSGTTSVNEAAITGEAIPVDKKEGDEVISGTSNINGCVQCKALKVGKETTLSQIIELVTQSSATKAPVQKIADKVSGIFVPVVIALSVITFVVWFLLGKGLEFSILRGISVLVISCPCALGLATPVAIMVGNGVGAKMGILFKNSVSLEQTGKVKVVVLDKTGTITKGQPVVTQIISSGAVNETEILRIASSIEKGSKHPLAVAIVNKAKELELELLQVTDFKEIPGSGVKALINGEEFFCGRLEDSELMCVKKGDKLLGAMQFSDDIKEDSYLAVQKLKELGVKLVMLTGDNLDTAKEVARKVGIETVFAQVHPDDKENRVRELKKQGLVMMVGDGINDAPALTTADIGVAVGAGSDIAIDSADVVLVKNSIMDVYNAIRLSRKVSVNIKENLFWAFIYNCLGIPLAAGCFSSLFGWNLNPMFSAAAMSISSFCVVTNSLRLNYFKK